MAPELVTIKPEYTVKLPLWDCEGALANEDDYRISAALDAQLRAFEVHWEDLQYEVNTSGWEGTDDDPRAEGQRLRDALQRELGPTYRVKLHLP